MTMRVAALILAVVCGVGVGTVRDATAQPWAQGVSDSDKNAAKAKLEEGNNLYLTTDYKGALAKYEEALKSWNHPAIRFNVVRCLIQLDRPVEASDNLVESLKYGKDPFEETIYQEALSYQKLLASQIGEVEIGCTQEGAKLTFDGQPFIDKCPGKEKRRVTPGRHAVVASKEGFLTKEMPVIVIGGQAESVDVKLVPLDKAAKVVHRWPTWIPWVVFGGGLAVTGLGVLLEVDAQNQMNQYDQDVAGACAVNGCNLNATLNEMMTNKTEVDVADRLNAQRERAESRDRLAIGVIAVGAVGAAVGGVLLFLNRGQTVYEDPTKAGEPVVNVTPTRDGGATVSLSGRF
jgi:hypothetical protein